MKSEATSDCNPPSTKQKRGPSILDELITVVCACIFNEMARICDFTPHVSCNANSRYEIICQVKEPIMMYLQ